MIENFNPLSKSRFDWNNSRFGVQNSNKPWSVGKLNEDTLRFEVRSGDQWYADPDWKERSEIAMDRVIPLGKIITLSYGFLVESGPPNQATGGVGPGIWLTFGQFHSDDAFSSSAFAVEMIREKLAIRASYKIGTTDKAWYVYTTPTDIERGKRYNLKLKARFLNNADGFLDLFLDGVQVVAYKGPLGYGAGTYWKCGIYRREQVETIAIQYSNMSILDQDPVAKKKKRKRK